MIFSSYEFFFVFLPIVFIGYFALGNMGARIQKLFLVLASLFFYVFFNPSYLLIIIGSIVANFGLAKLISRFKSNGADKVFLVIGILFNIGMLGYFKYTDFLIENVNSFFGTNIALMKILLPLGISFFTFQQFSFLISVFKEEEKIGNFFDYALFVTFFPQLVAGPIVLYSEMMPQFSSNKPSRINYDNLAKGIYIFSLGMFKKIVIADSLAIFVDNGFAMSSELGFVAAWVTALSYTFQIYFDFSGYCDMAVGLGRMFNIVLPINFNSPYKSKSISEFWKRWHMTLGRALAYYVYIPLGGNRKGKIRTYINLMVTFFASGLWHGASWSFVIWGIFHGIFAVMDRIFEKFVRFIPGFIRMTITFIIVNFLWVFFRAESVDNAMNIYKGMLRFDYLGIDQMISIAQDGLILNMTNGFSIWYVGGFLLVSFAIVFGFKNNQEKLDRIPFNIITAFIIAIIVVISVVHMSRISPFIYFNF